DKPGKCPICGMELIPVYKGSENQVIVSEDKIAILGMKSVLVEKKQLIKKIQFPVKVAKDEELYIIQQEILSTTGSGEILKSATLKLKLMGFSEEWINRIINQRIIDESLILPTPHRAWLIADVYEQDLLFIKSGQKVKIRLFAYPDREFYGRIVAVEPQINPETRRAKARILVNHPVEKFFVDMYAEATIEIPIGEHLVIPYSSVIETGKRKLAYVEVTPGVYEMRSIIIGPETDEYVAVIDGLSENEKVVVEGNFLLDSQTTLAGGQSLLYGAGEEVKERQVEPQLQHQH
ncbi:MAG: efflux RND transporter periplasmic adaptor subunit, partial [bacterium]